MQSLKGVKPRNTITRYVFREFPDSCEAKNGWKEVKLGIK